MTTQVAKEQAAAEERHDLLTAEIALHASNIADELRRFAAATAHIEDIYRLRLS